MSVKNENAAGGESVVLERPAAGGVYASLFKKINLNPVSELSALDIRAREAVNSNAGGVALSTVVRIYQLKDRKTFDTTDYPSLFKADSQAIKADLVAEKDIRLQPGGAVTVDMPMEESAQYVAVAGMFMSPDQENNTWRVVLSRDDLDPDKARVIEAGNNRLTLQALKDE